MWVLECWIFSKRLPFELLLDVLSDLDKDISDSFICKKLEDYLGVEVFAQCITVIL